MMPYISYSMCYILMLIMEVMFYYDDDTDGDAFVLCVICLDDACRNNNVGSYAYFIVSYFLAFH